MTFKFNYETSKGIKQVILTNCGQAPFKRFSILGNSHQDSTTGKQLFKLTDNYLHAYFYHGENKEIVPYSSNAVVYLPCEPNTTYTIHGRKNINNDMTRKNRVGLTSELPAFNVKITKTAETTLDKPLTITTEEDTKYLVIIAITDGEIGKLNFDKVLENNTSKLMVEVGDKASPYEPYTGGKPSPSHDYPQQIKNVGKWNEEKQKYEVDVKVTNAEQNWSKEQVLTLTSDRPLTKWDKLVEQDGQIGWLYGSKKTVLNEKTSWKVFRIDPNEEDNFTFSMNLIGSLGGNQTSFCKTFKNVNYAYAKEHRGKYGLYSDHVEQRVLTRYFRQPNESVQTIEQWKEWLINNPIELWHKSETEFVPLPQEEQDAVRNLKTYYPTTVITVDGGDVDAGIEVEYAVKNKEKI